MNYILLSVLASTGILVLFRALENSAGKTPHVITCSYVVSAALGLLIFQLDLSSLISPWLWPAAIEGIAFFLVFRAIAKTTQRNGVSVAAIATKMSVVIPICIGLFFLGDAVTPFKLLGILLGIIAVLLSVGQRVKLNDWRWPLLAFLGTGMVDASFKLLQVWGLTESQFPSFVTTTFGFAFLAGAIAHFAQTDRHISLTSIGSGVVLGCLNFASTVFILKALAAPGWDSATVYSLNHFGGMMAATIAAILIFKEKINAKGWAGLLLATLSIVLLFFAAQGASV